MRENKMDYLISDLVTTDEVKRRYIVLMQSHFPGFSLDPSNDDYYLDMFPTGYLERARLQLYKHQPVGPNSWITRTIIDIDRELHRRSEPVHLNRRRDDALPHMPGLSPYL